jgi:hypothetical protein
MMLVRAASVIAVEMLLSDLTQNSYPAAGTGNVTEQAVAVEHRKYSRGAVIVCVVAAMLTGVAGSCEAVAVPLTFENAGWAQLLLPVVHPCDQLFPVQDEDVFAAAAVPRADSATNVAGALGSVILPSAKYRASPVAVVIPAVSISSPVPFHVPDCQEHAMAAVGKVSQLVTADGTLCV